MQQTQFSVEELTQFSNEELIKLIAMRNVEAFNVFVDRWGLKLRGYLKKLLKNPAAVDDVMQNILLAVWKGAPSFTLEKTRDVKSAFSCWVYKVTRNKVYDWTKKNKFLANHIPLEPGGLDVMNPNENDPLEELANAVTFEDFSHDFNGNLNKLTEVERFIFWQKYGMGKTFAEVTVAVNREYNLNMKENAVKVAAHRAKIKLRKLLMAEEKWIKQQRGM